MQKPWIKSKNKRGYCYYHYYYCFYYYYSYHNFFAIWTAIMVGSAWFLKLNMMYVNNCWCRKFSISVSASLSTVHEKNKKCDWTEQNYFFGTPFHHLRKKLAPEVGNELLWECFHCGVLVFKAKMRSPIPKSLLSDSYQFFSFHNFY